MKQIVPTDFDPSAGIPRPDQVMKQEPMPTLADFGVRTRSVGASSTTAVGGVPAGVAGNKSTTKRGR
jgi:hypothetical protein